MHSTIEYILEVVLKGRPKKPPPGRGAPTCLKKVADAVTSMQLGFDGEWIIKDALEKQGWKNVKLTTHKDTVDILATDPHKQKWMIEAKAHRSTASKFQADVDNKQRRDKIKLAAKHKAKEAMMVVVIDYGDPKKGMGWAHVRFKEGYGAYRFSAMGDFHYQKNWLKTVGRGKRALMRFYEPEPDKRNPKLWYKWNNNTYEYEWRPNEDKPRKTRRKKK